MTPEQLKANSYYKGSYDSAIATARNMGHLSPDTVSVAWEDLTDQQRENVRLECVRYQKELDSLGQMIRGEKPMGDPSTCT